MSEGTDTNRFMGMDAASVVQAMGELTNILKEHKTDKATIDWDTVKETFGEQIAAHTAAQVAEAMARRPMRGNAQLAYRVDSGQVDTLLNNNPYARLVRGIARDGYARDGFQKVQAVDFWLARQIVEAQWAIKQGKGRMDGDKHAAPASTGLQNALKALTSTGTGTGDELVPEIMATELWEDLHLMSMVANNITPIAMPSDPYPIPLGLGDISWRKGTENVPTTVSDPATAKSTLTTTEQVSEQTWSYTLDEDAAMAMAPVLRVRLGISGAENIDAFCLNADSTDADTGNINLDDANPADDAYYLSDGQDGLRHQWLVDNTGQGVNAGGDAIEDADLVAALAKQGKYAVNPNQVVMVTDISTYLVGMLDLDTVIGLDKFGPNTPIITGQLAAYRGYPVVVSASHGLAEADGKLSTTTGSNTLGSATFYNRLMWYLGFMREVLVEIDRDIRRRSYIMVTSYRQAIGAHGTRASNTHTSGIRNILV